MLDLIEYGVENAHCFHGVGLLTSDRAGRQLAHVHVSCFAAETLRGLSLLYILPASFKILASLETHE